MANNTWKIYNTAIESFNAFRRLYNLDQAWPASIEHLAHFIAYLSHKGLSVSTVVTYISGISHFQKLHNFNDSTKSFIITKLIEGFRRKHPQCPDIRVPITTEMLRRIIKATHSVCSSSYESCMFSASFSLAFYALLRVSEIAVDKCQDESGHALNFSDANIQLSKNTYELNLKVCSSKTDQRSKSVTIILRGQTDLEICPIMLIQAYLKVRCTSVGCSNKLFVHFNGKPMTKYQFRSVLKKCLIFCDIPLYITSHSFRIGGATELAKKGVPDEVIKQAGRWVSIAYQKYIRL